MSEGMLDIQAIFRRLPHRPPLLLVDRVIELKEGHRIVAIKNVTINEDFFRGHFPGNPIMPGVLILEAMAQTAGLLVPAEPADGHNGPPLSYLVGLDGVKFRRPVVPGDRLQLEAEVLQHRAPYWRFRAVAQVDSQRAAEATLLLGVFGTPEESE